MSSKPTGARGYLEIPEQLNLASYVVDRHVEEGRGARIAAWAEGRAYTFADLRALTNRFANALCALGVGHGDHVMLRLGTSLDTLIAILGTIKAGAIVLPTSFLFRDHEVEKILLNSEAVVAVSTPELLGPIESVSARTPMLRHIILAGADGGAVDGRRTLAWERVMAEASPEFAPARTHRDQPAFVIYTSGTTGDPKGVQQAHRWLIGSGDPYNREMVRMSADDVCYQPQDWSFIYPLGSGCLYPLMEGAAIVVPHGRFTPEAAFETIERHRVTIFAAVPTIYRMMLALPDAERRYRLDSLRACVSAGEALPADTFNEFRRRFGVTIYDGIGQTETHIFIGNRIGMEIRPGSMGKPLRGYEAAILDDEGHEQKRGEPGHLVLRNGHPGLTLGYRKAPARWAAVNRGRMVLHAGHRVRRCRRLLLVRLALRRFDKKPRVFDLAQGGRVRAAGASSGARSGGGGDSRSADWRARQRFRRAACGTCGLRRAGRGNSQLRARRDRALQGAASDRIHGGAAQDSQRQNSAPRAARPQLKRGGFTHGSRLGHL